MEEDQEEGGAAAEGPTFAERLAALQLQEGGGSGGGAAGKRGAKPAPAAPAGPLKADSLSVLLSQALQSGDRALLERCLTGERRALLLARAHLLCACLPSTGPAAARSSSCATLALALL